MLVSFLIYLNRLYNLKFYKNSAIVNWLSSIMDVVSLPEVHAKDYYLSEVLAAGSTIKVQRWTIIIQQTDVTVCLEYDQANSKVHISVDQEGVQDLNFEG